MSWLRLWPRHFATQNKIFSSIHRHFGSRTMVKANKSSSHNRECKQRVWYKLQSELLALVIAVPGVGWRGKTTDNVGRKTETYTDKKRDRNTR